MTESAPEPNTEQVTVWRNLLDAFGQLSAAWEAAAEAELQTGQGKGPGSVRLPGELVTAFARAGEQGAEALTGVAAVLAAQQGSGEPFAEVTESQRGARELWQRAHRAVSAPEGGARSGEG